MTNRWLLFSLLLLSGLFTYGQTIQLNKPYNGSFTVQLQDSGLLTSCRKTGDTFPTNYIRPGHPWGKVLTHASATPIIESNFRLDGDSMIWTIRLLL